MGKVKFFFFFFGNYCSLRSQSCLKNSINELMKVSECQRSRPFFDLGQRHSDFKVKLVFLKNSWAIWNQSSCESLRENGNENLYK